MEYITTESREPRGVEEAGCKIYSGAPTVSQTTGQIRVLGRDQQNASKHDLINAFTAALAPCVKRNSLVEIHIPDIKAIPKRHRDYTKHVSSNLAL